jgi:hypothetical protein
VPATGPIHRGPRQSISMQKIGLLRGVAAEFASMGIE